MNAAPPCDFQVLCSAQCEAAFFACMGPFFASRAVRRECGGYALDDGPAYRWFVARRRSDARVLGFISIEQGPGLVRIRHGYVVPEARGQGLFRQLRTQVLEHADALGARCTACLPQACLAFLAPWGFQVQRRRGNWVTLERAAYASVEPPHS